MDYLVRQTIGGAGAALKEYTIGTDVFGKPESFDPRLDPIVRVEARRLRAKLNRYYGVEGRADPLAIELPHGNYATIFRAKKHGGGRGNGAGQTWIAVVPVSSLGRSTELRYFSRGLSAELLHWLSGLGETRILFCESQAAPAEGMQQWARRAGADWVLECTVRQERRCFQISAQLLKVGDGSLRWSEMRESAVRGRIASQREIALAIARGVSAAVGLGAATPAWTEPVAAA